MTWRGAAVIDFNHFVFPSLTCSIAEPVTVFIYSDLAEEKLLQNVVDEFIYT